MLTHAYMCGRMHACTLSHMNIFTWGGGVEVNRNCGERQDAVSLVCMYPAYAVFELSVNNHLLSV